MISVDGVFFRNDDETYIYDSCSLGIGKLCSITTSSGEMVSYSYDGLGQITTVTTNAGSIGYTYAGGYVQSITYPSQRTVRYLRDMAGQITDISVIDQGSVYLVADQVSHLPFGPAIGWQYGNGIFEKRQYDLQYRPLVIDAGGQSMIQYFAYDGAGNLLLRTVNTDQHTLTYDALGRLKTATGSFGSEMYDYDAVGNRVQLIKNDQMQSYMYEPQSNRLLDDGIWNYTLDGNGNEYLRQASNGSGWEQTYTLSNRLFEVKDIQDKTLLYGTYNYNALGQRTSKTTSQGDTRFIYGLSGELLAELGSTGEVIQEYIYLDGIPIALLGTASTTADGYHFVHSDALGTPVRVTDAHSTLIWEAIYSPFGQATVNEDLDNNGVSLTLNLRFPGQYYDAETGRHYNYFRDYDPNTGRYIQSDPIGLNGGVNTYGYVGGNPVNLVDPWGLIQVKPGANISNISPSISSCYDAIDKAIQNNSNHNEAIITSGNNGKHKGGSKHYSNEAIDIRGNNVTDKQMQNIADNIRNSLGNNYDVILEYFPNNPVNDHIHIEYDPN